MRYRGVPDDLVELARYATAGADFEILIGSFIDYNKSLVKKSRQAEAVGNFQSPPPLIGASVTGGDVMDAFLAAMTEKLFQDWDLGAPPQWINVPNRFLGHPHFSIETRSTEFKEKLKRISPEPFRKRNLFYTDRVLDRC